MFWSRCKLWTFTVCLANKVPKSSAVDRPQRAVNRLVRLEHAAKRHLVQIWEEVYVR